MALKDGLVSYYSLDETSGIVEDSHGDNNGTNNGATRGITGKINNAFDFDGDNDYVELPDDLGLNSPTGISIGGWFKLDSTSSEQRVLTLNAEEDNPYISFRLNLEGTANKIGVALHSSQGEIKLEHIGATLTEWNFIYITSVEGSNAKLYVNGVERDSSTDVGDYSRTTSAHKNYLGTSRNLNKYLDGKIDEVGIWSRALTSSEIGQLYNGGDGLSYDKIQQLEQLGQRGEKWIKTKYPLNSLDREQVNLTPTGLNKIKSIVRQRDRVGLIKSE
jgi:hypothetical protein